MGILDAIKSIFSSPEPAGPSIDWGERQRQETAVKSYFDICNYKGLFNPEIVNKRYEAIYKNESLPSHERVRRIYTDEEFSRYYAMADDARTIRL